MKYETCEKLFMFLVLTSFNLMLSCFQLENMKTTKDKIIEVVRERVKDKDTSYSSYLWKLIFNSMKWLRNLCLIIFFCMALRRGINNFYSVMLMIFFVVFSTSEWVFENCSGALVIFASGLILGQYYFSLYYCTFKQHEDPAVMKTLEWWSIADDELFKNYSDDRADRESCGWFSCPKREGPAPEVKGSICDDDHRIDDIYWRFSPNQFWFVLILMHLLNETKHIIYTMKDQLKGTTEYANMEKAARDHLR